MSFISYSFIFIFLPAMVVGFYSLNRINIQWGKAYLTIGSLIFYWFAGWRAFLVLVVSILFNWRIDSLIQKKNSCRTWYLVSVIGNITILFLFKYVGFTLEILNTLAGTDFALKQLIIPLGISFYTFEQIVLATCLFHREILYIKFTDYLFYVLYFPKLAMGPIAEPNEILSQINCERIKEINWNRISSGIKLFSYGFFKKTVLADTFSGAVFWAFDHYGIATSMDLILAALFYTFEIYFDFSGYCDMATGVSEMLNIRLPINFDSPYQALSIREFWRKWHITLSRFLTKHVYIPLGGSREGSLKTCANIMAVFLVSGLWHGANWTFILWGICHGLLIVMEKIFDRKRRQLNEPVRWMLTFALVNVLWMLFASNSNSHWLAMMKKILLFQNLNISEQLLDCFILPETPFLLKFLHLKGIEGRVRGFSMLVFTGFAGMLCLIPKNNYQNMEKKTFVNMLSSSIAFVWALLCISKESVFVYFNF